MTRARGKNKFFRTHASTKQDLEIEHIGHQRGLERDRDTERYIYRERERERERFFANNTGNSLQLDTYKT
jgi:hypothetical protein